MKIKERIRPKKILVISPIPSHPQNVGNRTRVYTFLSHLKKLGHEIHFVYSHRQIVNPDAKHESSIKAMSKEWDNLYLISPDFKTRFSNFIGIINREIGLIGIFFKKYFPALYSKQKNIRAKLRKQKQFVPTSVDLLYNTNIDKFLEKLTKKENFDLVIVEYFFYSKALEFFGKNTLKIIDTHDSFSNRHVPYFNKLLDYREISTTPNEEAKALNRADIIIAIQDREKEFFKRITEKKVVTIGHILEPDKPTKRKSEGKNILFIGTPNLANIDAVNYSIKNIFPKIKEKFPDAKFLLAGTISDFVKNSEGIIKLGELENLKDAYFTADIIINPVFMGTGLKIKNIETLSYSKPLITTSLGAKGLEEGTNKAFLVADESEEFIKAINKLFSNSKFYNRLSKNAHKFIKSYNKKGLNEIKEMLNF